MSASGAVWAAGASALPFKRRAKTNGCSCHEHACGGIVGHWDVLHRRWNSPKTKCRCGSRESVVDEVAFGSAASEIRRQQRHRRRTHFRCSHSDICSFVNMSAREENFKVADNAAA